MRKTVVNVAFADYRSQARPQCEDTVRSVPASNRIRRGISEHKGVRDSAKSHSRTAVAPASCNTFRLHRRQGLENDRTGRHQWTATAARSGNGVDSLTRGT